MKMTTMKTFNIKSLLAIALVASVIVSCKQDVITLTLPVTPTPETPTGSKGNADFTKICFNRKLINSRIPGRRSVY